MTATLVILAIAFVLLLSDRVRADLVALLVVLALGLTGILTADEAFSGFSRGAVVTLFAIFVVAEGLRRTGVTDRVGDWLLRVGGRTERRLIVTVMGAAATLSLFMNNIAAASVLLPAVSGAARKARVSASRLLMPLAFATVLGGMATLFTTTNIIVSSYLVSQGLAGFGVLDFLPIGVPVVIAGILYMAVWGRHALPTQSPAERLQADRPAEDDLIGIYRLSERLFRARIPEGSILVGKPLAEVPLRQTYHVNVIAIERGGHTSLAPSPQVICERGDILTLQGNIDDFRSRDTEPYLEILPTREWQQGDLAVEGVVVVEAMLSPRSALIGQTLTEAHFRQKYGMTALAVWQQGGPVRTNLSDRRLNFGDTLLLQGPRHRLATLRTEPDIIVLREPSEATSVQRKGWLALGILVAAVVIAASGRLPTAETMLAAAILMVLGGILSMDGVYRSVEWRSIFLVAGLLPLGLAMTKTGAAAFLADEIINLIGQEGPYALLVGLIVFTAVITQAMSGQAVAAVVAPIAIQAAHQIGADPRAMAMGVALATSLAFVTPVSHPVNILVMGAGGYRFRDYVRVGLPLSILVLVIILVLMPVFWPLTPHVN